MYNIVQDWISVYVSNVSSLQLLIPILSKNIIYDILQKYASVRFSTIAERLGF